jgi:hypothetical protein
MCNMELAFSRTAFQTCKNTQAHTSTTHIQLPGQILYTLTLIVCLRQHHPFLYFIYTYICILYYLYSVASWAQALLAQSIVKSLVPPRGLGNRGRCQYSVRLLSTPHACTTDVFFANRACRCTQVRAGVCRSASISLRHAVLVWSP